MPSIRRSIFVLLCLLSSLAAAEPKRPNIIFVFSDDHAPHAIGAYSDWLKDINPTPNIDQLARQGMLFRNSFCTNSICGPSRAVILTGKHSHLNGFMHNGNRFDGSQQTFPKILQQHGYKTAMIGKWHLQSDPQGFDYWKVLPGQGDYYNPALLTPDGKIQTQGHCTEIVTNLALAWLKEQATAEQPFMLMCQHKAPHRNWMPAPQHLTLYDDVTIPEPETLFDKYEDNANPARYQEMEIDRHMHLVFDLFVSPEDDFDPNPKQSVDRSGFMNMKRMTADQRRQWDEAFEPKNDAFKKANLTGAELVRWKYQRYMKNYLRCIKGVDDSVGRIMSFLQDNGLEDNTIVIYSSDQGFYLGDHGWYDKRWMYEESLKMPLIVKWPGVANAGSEDHHLVQNLDYAATFLEMIGATVPDDIQGRSLVPLLKGESPSDWRQSIYYHYYEYPSVHMVAKHNGVRTDRYKLMHFYEFDEWEFYDLQNDPDELRNEFQNPDYANQIANLKTELARLVQFYGDDSDLSEKDAAWQKQYRQ